MKLTKAQRDALETTVRNGGAFHLGVKSYATGKWHTGDHCIHRGVAYRLEDMGLLMFMRADGYYNRYGGIITLAGCEALEAVTKETGHE